VIGFILLLWGLVYLLTSSSIFVRVRIIAMAIGPRVGQLAYCPACSGFWFGALLAALGAWPLEPIVWGPLDAAVSSCGLMGAVGYFIPTSTMTWELEQGVSDDATQQS
jgi:hypothetical protein